MVQCLPKAFFVGNCGNYKSWVPFRLKLWKNYQAVSYWKSQNLDSHGMYIQLVWLLCIISILLRSICIDLFWKMNNFLWLSSSFEKGNYIYNFWKDFLKYFLLNIPQCMDEGTLQCRPLDLTLPRTLLWCELAAATLSWNSQKIRKELLEFHFEVSQDPLEEN